jgi:hypothetical protein
MKPVQLKKLPLCMQHLIGVWAIVIAQRQFNAVYVPM